MASGWPTIPCVRGGVTGANPRVVAADPGAWLDGEPWTFTLTFTDPDGTTPTDLTGSRLFVQFQGQAANGSVTIQVCDSAANDGSLILAEDSSGQATFNAAPENRTWVAPRIGPGLVLRPSLVFGDVYRQLGDADPVCLTRIALRVLPSTGAPVGPAPAILIGHVVAKDALTGSVTYGVLPVSLSGAITGTAQLGAVATVIAPIAVSLSGVVLGGATLGAALSAVVPTPVAITGSIISGTSLGGMLTATASVALVGTVPGGGALLGNLSTAVALTGSVTGGATLTGNVSTIAANPLTGRVPAPAGPTGYVSVSGSYAGSVTGGASLAGAMSVSVAMTGSVAAMPALGGAMSVSVAMSGAVVGGAALTGAMTTNAPANLNGAIPAPTGPRGAMTVSPGLVNARKGRLAAATAA